MAESKVKIDKFSGDYRWLSNFWLSPVVIDGITYNSSETAYQAAKTTDLYEQMKISTMTPGAAKRYGRTLRIRPDWEDVKVTVMKKIVCEKFKQNPELARKLIATTPLILEEGNTWNDRFWGVCGGLGENNLGKILMDVRGALQQ